MGFEDWKKENLSISTKPISNFQRWQTENEKQVVPQDVQEPVRPLQGTPDPLKEKSFGGTGASGTWDEPVPKPNIPWVGFQDKAEPVDIGSIDMVRSLKDFANVVPETAKESAFAVGGKIPAYIAAYRLSKRFKDIDVSKMPVGFKTPTVRELHKLIKEKSLEKLNVPEFEVRPSANIAEKAADIATGVAKFATKLVVLKKANPAASGGALWEIENLSSGGIPGMGYAMHAVFADTGRMIKGTGKAKEVGRIGLQSAGLAGLSALEQKIETGKIDPIQVGTAAGIPIALRTVKGITDLIKKRDPRIIKYVETQQVTKVPEKITKGWNPPKGMDLKQFDEWIHTKGTPSGKAKSLDLLDQWKYYKSLPYILSTGEEVKIPTKTIPAKPKPQTIDTANKDVLDWVGKAKLLNEIDRKEAVHRLKQKQAGMYSQAKKKELQAGATPFKAHMKARKAMGGRADVPEISPLKLTPEQLNLYGKQIEQVYTGAGTAFQNQGAYNAINKMTKGRIPTDYEFGLLEPILGVDTTTALYKTLTSKRAMGWQDVPQMIRDIPKAIRFGFDPQSARGLSKISARHPLIYLSSVWKNIRGLFSQSYTNKIQGILEKDPAWRLGKNAYGLNQLSIKPWASVKAGTRLEQFGNISEVFLRSDSKLFRGIGKWLKGAERGANLGMNSAFNKLVKKSEKDLANYANGKNLSAQEISAWRKRRGTVINVFTKRLTAKNPKIKDIQRAANWLVFSPAYTASGLVAPPHSVKKLLTGKGFSDKTYGMTLLLSRLAALSTISTAIGYTGYRLRAGNPTEEPKIDSSANPLDPLFGKLRSGDEVYDLGFGDIAEYRLIAQIGFSAHMAVKEALTGKQVTETSGGRKPPSAGEAFNRYLNSKRTLYLTLGKQLASGKNWIGQPVTLKDTILDNIPFEFLQAFVEAGEADGTWASMEEGFNLEAAKKSLGNLTPAVAALGGFGTGSYPIHTTDTRRKFQDIISKEGYNKKWDDLSSREQSNLKKEYKSSFDSFEEKIRKEKVDVPFSMEKMQAEEKEANQRVTKMLSTKSRQIVKEVDLGLSRRPKDFYLSDARYNRYQQLFAEELDNKLSESDLDTQEDNIRRTKRIKLKITNAKNRAYSQLRREIDGR